MRNPNSKLVLGLDLGVASIGWALVQQSPDPSIDPTILGMGVRVIPLSIEEKDEFSAGSKQSKNANRRIKRGIRRNLQRFTLRKHRLVRLLTDHHMLPSPELFALGRQQLWDLRARAARERIDLTEFGRVLFHINQKRGFKSNRKTDPLDDAAEAGKAPKEALRYTEKIQARQQTLEASGLSIGAYFAAQLREHPHAKMREAIYPRAAYIAEFDLLWATQARHYPHVLTEELRTAIRDRTIFHQRPLKSAKGLVNGCRYEKRPYKDAKSGKWIPNAIPAAPISSPLYQEFRIWQELANVRIVWKDGRPEEPLTPAQKQQLYTQLSTSAYITATDFLKTVLGKSAKLAKWNRLGERLPGNKTLAQIRKALLEVPGHIDQYGTLDLTQTQTFLAKVPADDPASTERVLVQREEVIPAIEKEPAYQLWNLLYSAEDNEVLARKLVHMGFPTATAQQLTKVKLEDGYGTLSTKALRRILPCLRQGMTYDAACATVGYQHSDYEGKDEILEKLAERLAPIHKGELRNPVVERILNQCVNVVNAILETYGHPDEIHVELARELKQNAKQRERASRENNARDRENKKIAALIEEQLPFQRVTREDIEKYRLWEEMGKISPYEPNRPISIQELFGGDVDIEHIIPRSRLFDDSFQNKTIARRGPNRDKGNRTGYDYMQSLGEQALHDYLEFIQGRLTAKGGISPQKAKILKMKQADIPTDFVARQIKETQYISKEALTRMRPLVRQKTDLLATSGGITAFLRHHWGLDDLLKALVWDKYAKLGKTKERKDKTDKRITYIQGWSKRDDHRHHALDALVVAMTSRSLIQRLNTLNADADARFQAKEDKWKPKAPWSNAFVGQLTQAMQGIIISLKPGKRDAVRSKNRYKRGKHMAEQMTWTPRGELHKETVYGINYSQTPTMVKLDGKIDPEGIVDPRIRARVLDHIARHGGHAPTALDDLKRHPIWLDEAAKIPLKEVYYRQPRTVKRSHLRDLKAKDIPDVVDARVRAILQARITSHGEAKTFDNLEQDPVWFNEAAGIKIERVRVYERPSVDSVRKIRRGYVALGNNHHAALYRDAQGKLQEHLCTFWDAVARRKAGISPIVRDPQATFDAVVTRPELAETVLRYLPDPSWTFVQSYAQNELFLICPDEAQAEALLATKDLKAMSPWVFRVQKITAGDYFFRHHLETSVAKNEELKEAAVTGRTKRITAIANFPRIKLRFNLLGHLIDPQP
jgi:CRISPR-associated endonuclease Csn1